MELSTVATIVERCARLPVRVAQLRSVRPLPVSDAAVESDVIRGVDIGFGLIREF